MNKKETTKVMTEKEIKDKIKSTLNQIIIAAVCLSDGPIMRIYEEVEKFEKAIINITKEKKDAKIPKHRSR